MGACGGEGVGGRPDPPDGRKSVPDFSRDLFFALYPILYSAVYCVKIDHWSILKEYMGPMGGDLDENA